MALRLKGIASNEHIAEITGKGQAEVDDVLNMMQEKSYAQETPRGLRLLPEGKNGPTPYWMKKGRESTPPKLRKFMKISVAKMIPLNS